MDKKTLILQCAMEQFAEKGYHQATIQDIADAAGIAKGGIYFYFKSKEELVHAVFVHYHDQLFKSVSDAADRYASNPRESLIQQIIVQFNEVASHHSFISIFMRGQVNISKEMKDISIQMRTKFFIWFSDQIVDMYGPSIEPHAFDLSALMTSLVREYMGLTIVNGAQLPLREVAEFVVARLDNSAQGVLSSKQAPVLTVERLKSIFPDAKALEGSDRTLRLHSAVDALLQRLDGARLPDADEQSIQQALIAIREEFAQTKPRPIVLEGLALLIQGKLGAEEWTEMVGVKRILDELQG